jgi:hypothetical protein
MQYRWHFVLAPVAAVALASCSAPTPTAVPPTAIVAAATAVPATAAPQATATRPAATNAPTDAPKPTATTLPTSTTAPTQAAKATAAPASSGKPKVNMDELFPPGPGRQLVLDSCMNCHSMAPIVVSQKSKAEWNQLAIVHRDKVSRLSDEDFDQLMGYLIATFNPSHPVPQLPEELLSGWTNY